VNYALARITFRTDRLDDALYERLKAIPGVKPWEPYGRRTAWTAPYTGAFIAQSVLDRAGVRYTCDVPLVDPLANFGDPEVVRALCVQVRDRALRAGVHEWVIHGWIKDFQLVCAAWAVDRRRSFVRAEPGAGKTAIAVVGAACLGLPVIVVTRDSVVGQYAREWRRLTTWDVLERRSESRMRKRDESYEDYCERMRAWFASDSPAPPPVVVLGWSMLAEWVDSLIVGVGQIAPRGFFVIFDESQYAKNSKRRKWSEDASGELKSVDLTNLTASALKLAKAADAVLLTSATPVANALIDLFGQMSLVEPDAWGHEGSEKAFAFRYCGARPGLFGGLTKTGVNEATMPELLARMSFSTITIPYSVSHAQLPPKMRMLVRIEAADQIEEVTGMGKKIRDAQKAAEKDRGDGEAVANAHRLQLARAASRKRKAVVQDVIERTQTGKGKILLFSGWRKDCEDLAERLTKAGAKIGESGLRVWCSHGEDSRDEREQILADYMAHPGPCVLVGTWQSWGEGLNLDDTDVLGFVMLPYTPREISQGEGRGDRISMKRPLLLLYYVAEGTYDETVIDRVVEKVRQEAMASQGEGRLSAFGGIEATLAGTDRIEDVADRMHARGEAPDLDALFGE